MVEEGEISVRQKLHMIGFEPDQRANCLSPETYRLQDGFILVCTSDGAHLSLGGLLACERSPDFLEIAREHRLAEA